MQLEMTVQGNVSRVSLEGRLDTPGVDRIETRFTASVVSPGRNALVDLSAVTFVSSMGIRMLISSARALGLKHAKMVLFGVQPLVMQTLEHASLADMIPIATDETQALALFEAA